MQARTVLAILAALLFFASPPAARAEMREAKVYVGISGPELQDLLQTLGYRAQLAESEGRPRIATRFGGYKAYIRGYNCTDGTCNNLHFTTGVNLKSGTTLEKANEYNRTKIFGGVYLDRNGDPWLEMTCNVAGGVTARNLEYVIDRYVQAVDIFARHFALR